LSRLSKRSQNASALASPVPFNSTELSLFRTRRNNLNSLLRNAVRQNDAKSSFCTISHYQHTLSTFHGIRPAGPLAPHSLTFRLCFFNPSSVSGQASDCVRTTSTAIYLSHLYTSNLSRRYLIGTTHSLIVAHLVSSPSSSQKMCSAAHRIGSKARPALTAVTQGDGSFTAHFVQQIYFLHPFAASSRISRSLIFPAYIRGVLVWAWTLTQSLMYLGFILNVQSSTRF